MRQATFTMPINRQDADSDPDVSETNTSTVSILPSTPEGPATISTADEETIRKLTKELLILSSGTTALRAIKTISPFIISILMARLGGNVPPSVTIINAVEAALSVIFNSPLFYLPTVVGQAIDAEKFSQVGSEAQASWVLGILCSVPQIAIILSLEKILSSLGQNNTVIDNASIFFKAYAFGVPILSLQSASDQIVITTKNYKLPVLTQLSSWSIAIALSYGLGFGKFGLPNLGIRGPAYAMAGRAYLNALLFHAPLFLSQNYKRYELFGKNPDFLKIFKRQLINGLLLFFAFLVLTGNMFFNNMLVGKFGDESLAAQLVISQYSEILLVPAAGIGSAAQIAIANNKISHPSKIKKYGHIAVGLSLPLPILYFLLMTACPTTLAEPFLSSSTNTTQGAIRLLEDNHLFHIAGANVLLNTVCMVIGSSLMGADKMVLPIAAGMFINVLGTVLGYAVAKNIIELNSILLSCQFASTIAVFCYWTKQKFSSVSPAENPQIQDPFLPERFTDVSPRRVGFGYGSTVETPTVDKENQSNNAMRLE